MPKYKYRCADCGQEVVAFHSIREKLRDCLVCGVSDSLIRVPGAFVSSFGEKRAAKAGELTRETIEEFREDLERQKREQAQEKYE